MTFYSGLQSTASRLLERFGTEVVIQRAVQGVIDPVVGVRARLAPETLTTTGVFQKIPTMLADDTRIKQGDYWLTIDSSVKPEITDKLLIDGVSWSIINIETVKPADTAIVYRLQVRR
jgi:hypothetical protein